MYHRWYRSILLFTPSLNLAPARFFLNPEKTVYKIKSNSFLWLALVIDCLKIHKESL